MQYCETRHNNVSIGYFSAYASFIKSYFIITPKIFYLNNFIMLLDLIFDSVRRENFLDCLTVRVSQFSSDKVSCTSKIY